MHAIGSTAGSHPHGTRLHCATDPMASGPGRHRAVRVAALRSADRDAVVSMLGRCCPVTLYRRFHGVTTGVFHAARLLEPGSGQEGYGAWRARTCVGLGSLALDDDGSAHLGVLVEDRWQRHGVGSALIAALVSRAQQCQVPGLVADLLPENRFLIPLLERIGPATTTLSYGGYRVRVDLDGVRPPSACPPPGIGSPAWNAR